MELGRAELTACTARTTPRASSPTVPHPNAGRLWIEHILSDEGALGYLEGGAIPARYATLVENGTITEDMLANLPPAELIEQVAFPTAEQIAAAQAASRRELGADGLRHVIAAPGTETPRP